MNEDQIIDVVASAMRRFGHAVLAEGANQMRAFRFDLPSGRKKAPDLAFVIGGALFVFEAKVKARDLFVPRPGCLSDYDAMAFVATSRETQKWLSTEATRRLRACGRGEVEISNVFPGVLASDTLSSIQIAGRPPIEVFTADAVTETWSIESSVAGAQYYAGLHSK